MKKNCDVCFQRLIEKNCYLFSALASALVGNWGWFLGMLLAILLLGGLIAFFIVLRRRGASFTPITGHSPSDSYDGDSRAPYTGNTDSKLLSLICLVT
jgi:hypothetical protein